MYIDWNPLIYDGDGKEKSYAMVFDSESSTHAIAEFCKLNGKKQEIVDAIRVS